MRNANVFALLQEWCTFVVDVCHIHCLSFECATLIMHLLYYRSDLLYVTFSVYPLKCAPLIMHLPYYRNALADLSDGFASSKSEML